MFDRIDAKRKETKDSKENVRAFLNDNKKEPTQENLGTRGTEFVREFEKVCNAEGIQIYSTMSETKAAFAECAIRSLKNVFTVTWKIMDTSIFTSSLNSLQHGF